MMTRPTFTDARYAALGAVHRDRVRYDTGLSGPALGYTWSEDTGGPMSQTMRQALRDLWTADLIDVDTHRLFAQHGHRVTTTINGYRLLREWHSLDLHRVA
jgi:hypothetical protein